MTAPWTPSHLPLGLHLGFTAASGALQTLMASWIAWDDAARVITSEHARENLFDQVASAEEWDDVMALADLTNPAMRAAHGDMDLVALEDRLYGPGTGLIMSAFSWPGHGSRFSNGDFGVFYAGKTLATAIAETVYHQARFLAGSPAVIIQKSALLVTVRETLVDIRTPQPVPPGITHPTDYQHAQAFGALLRQFQAFGVVYDSVRHSPDGECVAIFRPPALVPPVRVHQDLEYHWDGQAITVR